MPRGVLGPEAVVSLPCPWLARFLPQSPWYIYKTEMHSNAILGHRDKPFEPLLERFAETAVVRCGMNASAPRSRRRIDPLWRLCVRVWRNCVAEASRSHEMFLTAHPHRVCLCLQAN